MAPSRPVIWLFTDAARLADPLPAVRRLPRGLAGVVFRPDGLTPAGRLDLGRALARLCRARRLVLVVAGDARLAAALGTGVHLRNGRWPGLAGRAHEGGRSRRRMISSSAHGKAALIRARRAGAAIAFLSPLFPTDSHPGAASLGSARFAATARHAGLAVAALGGLDGGRAAFLASPLGRRIAAIGAIGALAFIGARDGRLQPATSEGRA